MSCTATIAEVDRSRFEEFVDRTGDCHVWTGSLNHAGYGRFWLNGSKRAHRIAFEISRGRPPEGIVCHRCDNPRCVNPEHLYDGTPADNARDRNDRGRTVAPSGESHHAAVLNRESAAEIRRRNAAGETGAALAREFGVSKAAVYDIIAGRTWAMREQGRFDRG